MLSVENLNVYYGAIHALHDISFHVDTGEIVTLIGANGAGKTSILQSISALIPRRSGAITFDGKDLSHIPAHRLISMGLTQVPEGRRVFATMTVMENLEMGAYIRNGKENLNEEYERIFERLPRLKERRKQAAGTLSGGEQQMLAIGRALMSKPKMLLLDEPSMGLSPILVQEIFSIIQDVNKTGVTVLLVEQNAKMALNIANRAYVLETGQVVMSGDAKELSNNEQVRKAYLGG